MIATVTCQSFRKKARWLKARKRGVGASESAAVLGASPWGTALSVWSDKVGLGPEFNENEAMRWGSILEEPIAQEYQIRSGRTIERRRGFNLYRNDSVPNLLATPDGFQKDPDREGLGTLQIKNTASWKADDWDEAEGSFPLIYQIQVQHELAVTGLNWGTIAVLIGGNELRFIDFDRNEDFIQQLITKIGKFWKFVEDQEAPAVEGNKAIDKKILELLHPSDSGETIILPEISEDWDTRLLELKGQRTQIDQEILGLENKVKEALGDNTFGQLPDGSFYSWKSQNRNGYTVEPTTFRQLRRTKNNGTK